MSTITPESIAVLKSCPFCGREGVETVTCGPAIPNCPKCSPLYGCSHCDVWQDTPEDWNRRANESALDKVGRYEKMLEPRFIKWAKGSHYRNDDIWCCGEGDCYVCDTFKAFEALNDEEGGGGMNKERIAHYEHPCDKCCGSGVVFDQTAAHKLIKAWRESLNFPAKTLAGIARIPYTSYCKFENGRVTFSEARLRILVGILTGWQDHEEARLKEGE